MASPHGPILSPASEAVRPGAVSASAAKPTLLTLFSGGGVAECGYRAAGFQPVGAVEYDPAIAEYFRWTPYRQTCDQVLCYVKEHPGASAREVISHIRHHYSSDATARSCLVQWGRQGKVYGVRVEQDGRNIRFYAQEGSAR